MNNFFKFSISPIFLRFNVSITVRIAQYISFPLSFRNPPAIFSRFFTFLRSRSLMLLSNGTEKSCRNKRWLWLYFSIRFSSAFSSFWAYLCRVCLFSFLPFAINSSYFFSKESRIVPVAVSFPSLTAILDGILPETAFISGTTYICLSLPTRKATSLFSLC